MDGYFLTASRHTCKIYITLERDSFFFSFLRFIRNFFYLTFGTQLRTHARIKSVVKVLYIWRTRITRKISFRYFRLFAGTRLTINEKWKRTNANLRIARTHGQRKRSSNSIKSNVRRNGKQRSSRFRFANRIHGALSRSAKLVKESFLSCRSLFAASSAWVRRIVKVPAIPPQLP